LFCIDSLVCWLNVLSFNTLYWYFGTRQFLVLFYSSTTPLYFNPYLECLWNYILMNLKLVGRNHYCHQEDCSATKERFSCSAPPQPYTHCCARSNTWGCRVTCRDCWQAHSLPSWWIKDHEGKLL
jgi:hypothetical protein